MAAAEKELHTEMFMEDRIARLETHTEHFQKDLSRIEAKLDKLDEKLETKAADLEAKIVKLDEKIEAKAGGLETKLDALYKSLVAFQLETVKARMLDRVGWLLIAAGLLSVMARGFKWI